MEFILTNRLDNYARPLKCLNDQGGFNADKLGWRDLNVENRSNKVLYGISFRNIPVMVIPMFRLKDSKTESPVIANIIHSKLTNTGFEYNANEVGGGEQMCAMEYIAIGI